MSAIVKSTGFGGNTIPGMNIGVSESRQRSKMYWGDGIEEGDTIWNLQAIQKSAHERMIDAIEADPRAVMMIPLIDLIDPSDIRKAVFGNTSGEEFRMKVQKARLDFASEIDAQLRASTLKKATSTTSAANLMHNYSDEQVVMLFKKIYPFQALIPVEANHGKIAQWDAITETGTGKPFFGSEDPQVTESDMTDAIRTSTCKIGYHFIRVTKMARVAGQTQYPSRDLMAIRTLAANESIRNMRERCMIGVERDVTNMTPSFTSASSLEYAGIYELITNNTAASLTQTYSGGAATLDKIKPFLDKTINQMVLHGQTPTFAACDWQTFSIIGRGLNDFWRTEQIKATEFGFGKINIVTPVGELPLVPILFQPTTTGNYGSIIPLNSAMLARRVLWGDTYEELGNLNTSTRGVISFSETMIDKSDSNGTNSLQGGVFGITLP